MILAFSIASQSTQASDCATLSAAVRSSLTAFRTSLGQRDNASSGTVPVVACLFVAALVLVSAVAVAASFDGTYTGTLSCPAFPDQSPLRVEIAVTVSGRTATYEQAAKPGAASGDLGAHEGGSGSVSPSGEVVLTGSCRGGFSCVTEYRGDLSKTPMLLKGSQRWWFRSGERERKCEVELRRVKDA